MFKLKSIVTGMLISASLAAHAAEPYKMAYLTSWGLSNPDILEQSKVNTYMLSFGQWDAQGVISTSDGIASIPEYNAYYMSPGYVAWTNLKHNNPQRRMIISFGGQAYESIWSYISTPDQRQKVAQNLAALLTKNFPVYAKNLSPSQRVGDCLAMNWDGSCNYATYQTAGTVQLDGIDFDFEKVARLTDEEGANLLDLATRVKALIPSNKLMSLTTYHVGADPENCADNTITENCSFVESSRSAHNGEVIKLLEDSKNVFDFFNAMTYDAGTSYKYQVAMQNYAQHVGSKAKVLVGTSNNAQWASSGPFTETQANNVQRAKWAAENGYGGFFIWALGANSNQMSMADQVSYINSMIDAMGSSSATPSGEQTSGTPQKPATGTPQQPSTGTPQQPATGTPQQPATGTPQTPTVVKQESANLVFVNNTPVSASDMTAQFKLAKKINAYVKPGAWTPQITLPAGVAEGSVFTFVRAPYVLTKITTTEFGDDMPLDGDKRTYTYTNGKWTTNAITIDSQNQLTPIDGKKDGLSKFVSQLSSTVLRIKQGAWAQNVYLPTTALEGATVQIYRDSTSGWGTNVIVNGQTFALPIATDISFTFVGGSWKNPTLRMHYNTVVNRSPQNLKNDILNARKINATFQTFQ